MNHKTTRYARQTTIMVVLLGMSACATDDEFPVLTGDYLGQTPPGATPQLFAPEIVSTGLYTRDLAMTPEGDEIYFCVQVAGIATIMQTKLEDGRWTKPEVAPFATDARYMNFEPAISPDGQRFIFLSNRPPDGSPMPAEAVGSWDNADFWVMDRTADGWSEPYNLGPPVNSAASEYFPSITNDGTIYFTREDPETRGNHIYRSRLVGGEYQETELLGPEVNSTNNQFNSFIAPDESYIIAGVAGRADSHGGADYYISFRDDEDSWTGPINMGDAVNMPQGAEWSPYVSRDGRYFFFMSTRNVPTESYPERFSAEYLHGLHNQPNNGNPGMYWMDAGFIEELRREAMGR